MQDSSESTPKKILVIDDIATNVAILEEILCDDHEVTTASSGEEGIVTALAVRPDLILLDIMMPGISGIDVCRQIRSSGALNRTKIIMVSAKALLEDRLEGYGAGANGFVTKPFDEEELLAKVRVFLELKSAEELQDARDAGKGEAMSGILHNVGNILNGINISTRQVERSLRDSNVDDLEAIADVVGERSTDLANFITEDPRGKMLPEVLRLTAAQLSIQKREVLKELNSLKDHVDHITAVVNTPHADDANVGMRQAESVQDVLRDALQLTEGSTSQSKVEVEMSCDEEALLKADRHQVLQILVNLILNARDACLQGGSERRIRVHALVDERGSLHVDVSDTGIGMDTAVLGRVFDFGFTTKEEGQGIGLHHSKVTATMLGGSLTATSAGPGHGSTFTLTIPT